MPASELLFAAGRLLRRWGWAQGIYAMDGRGKRVDEMDSRAIAFCVVGALRRAGNSYVAPPKGFDEAQRRLKAVIEASGWRPKAQPWSLVEWNDAPGRTLAEVLAALELAAGAEIVVGESSQVG